MTQRLVPSPKLGDRASPRSGSSMPAWLLVMTLGAIAVPAGAQLPEARETVYDVIRRAAPGVRACAERAYLRGEPPSGGHAYTMRIDTSGRVREVRVRGRPQPQRYVRCAIAVFERLRFGPQPASISLEYPVNIDPVD